MSSSEDEDEDEEEEGDAGNANGTPSMLKIATEKKKGKKPGIEMLGDKKSSGGS